MKVRHIKCHFKMHFSCNSQNSQAENWAAYKFAPMRNFKMQFACYNKMSLVEIDWLSEVLHPVMHNISCVRRPCEGHGWIWNHYLIPDYNCTVQTIVYQIFVTDTLICHHKMQLECYSKMSLAENQSATRPTFAFSTKRPYSRYESHENIVVIFTVFKMLFTC